MKETISVLKIVLDFLNQLSDSELSDIMNKKAKLKLDYGSKANKIVDKENVKIICERLESLTTRECAFEYLKEFEADRNLLKSIAKEYKIPFTSKDKDSNKELVEKIIEGVVGAKLRFDALLNTKLE